MGIKLWRVGVDAAKDLLLGQLALDKPGPGYVHFSNALQREFYEQLTAEQRVLAKVAGRDAYRWVKRRPRNEQLDNRNYALHAAYGLGLHRYTDEAWSKLEAAVQPPVDLFSVQAQTPAGAQQPPVTPQKPLKPTPRPARHDSSEWSFERRD